MKIIPNIWNKYFKIAIILVASISCLSLTNINHYNILNIDDLEVEIADQFGTPTLSPAINDIPQWESFSTWQCFSTENIQAECSEIDYGALRVPTLRLRDHTTLHDFSLDPEPDLDCEQTLTKWVALLENQRSLCIYAAYLQMYHDNPFVYDGIEEWHLWIVDQIKTSKGYWRWREPENEYETE